MIFLYFIKDGGLVYINFCLCMDKEVTVGVV